MSVEKRYYELLNRLRFAENQFGRKPGSVCLVAVSKTQIPETIRRIAKLKHKDFAENQVQEAVQKITMLSNLECAWHFVGSIQGNKCRDIATHFDWVHSVDRFNIAKRLSNLRSANTAPLNVFLQVNLQGEKTKSGVTPTELEPLAYDVSQLPNLRLRGLMAIPAPETKFELQRRVFSRLKGLQNDLNRELNLTLDCLSMGMTDDLEAGVAEGATHVRIGTAIFGPRIDHGNSQLIDLEENGLT